MDTSANGQYGNQPTKRRRLNDPHDTWQPAAHEDSQAPPRWLPEPALSRHQYLDQSCTDSNMLSRLTLSQNSTFITSSAGSVSGAGGQNPWPFHDQTWFRSSRVQKTQTSHSTMSTMPSISTPMEILCAAAVFDGQERDAGPSNSRAVSGSEQNNSSLSKVVCFGRVIKRTYFFIRLEWTALSTTPDPINSREM